MALVHERMNRGRTQMGWLDSFHTFSFGGFHDPTRMGLRNLRVINEDRVIPGAGFGKHDHAHMDILTYVLSGTLRHEDSMGNGAEIHPGEVQLMSAGPGVTHSEMNASDTAPVHFLQIWLIPDRQIDAPTYESVQVDGEANKNRFGLIAGPDGSQSGVKLLSDTRVYLAQLKDLHSLSHSFDPDHAGFLHVIAGQVDIDGETLFAGDALQFENRSGCTITAQSDADLLLFDLP
ncbi:pirin family protein [uncultured Tateyamaria sp.]|uniref:pirin family protein n=1 Tax=uncultured Tateyamaria sp. TaxID=455651 RepID=UPI002610B53E|nr:pirin family protein [uncultured Tateyamaria sp.]